MDEMWFFFSIRDGVRVLIFLSWYRPSKKDKPLIKDREQAHDIVTKNQN
jgi:hypothetical protein